MSPFKVMLPVAEAQAVGFVNVPLVITGVGFTIVVVLPIADGQLPSTDVNVTLYKPDAACVAFVILGFCKALVNPLGPVHAKVIEPGVVVAAFNIRALPVQIGLLLVTVGVMGV